MILVTGATGFIGSSLVRHLLAAGHEVAALDRRPFPDGEEPLSAKLRTVTMDVENPEATEAAFQEFRPEVVIALAEGHGDMKSVVERSAMNLGVTIDAAERAGVKRVCFASSIALYMGLEGPFREDMLLPIDSLLHVGAMKKAGEEVAAWHNKHSPVQTISLRLANIYGPRYHSMMNSPSRLLFEALEREIPGKAPALPPAFYRMAADYCHVDDCCDAILRVVGAEQLEHRCYNVGGGAGTTEDHVRHAVNLACARNTVAEVKDSSDNYLDITRIADELGFRPKHDINSGIAAYREWLLANDR